MVIESLRRGFSTTDHIYTQTQIREEINEYRKPLCIVIGNTIPPKLFTTSLEDIFKKLERSGKGFEIGDERLTNLRLAGKVVLFSESENELKQLLRDLNRKSVKVGLNMIRKETRVMFNTRKLFSFAKVFETVAELKFGCGIATEGILRIVHNVEGEAVVICTCSVSGF
ncbi:uncharacterized protein LOC125044880 [Penaeus chinensis]|uniref:uncharacterized protein LOC125044880 n=1 Tax=Penaeus chinensis TaxID=139456 RepID=UPI001FB6781A|nr:uncharacterized protein LOC125044880 [Penaeus chinensis]